MDAESKEWLAALAGRCHAARKAAGLSFRDAADTAGVSLSTIQRSESGGVDTGADVLRKLASAYGIDLCELMLGRPAEPPKKGKKP